MYNQWTMMRESPLENCWAEPSDNGDQIDLFTWDAIIFGPAGNITIVWAFGLFPKGVDFLNFI
jgi:hypothetical protein